MKLKNLTATAILLSVSLIMSIVESLVPLQLLVPIPGVKLGFANIAVMAAVIFIDKKCAFLVVFLRSVIMLMLFGNVTSFFMSLAGGIFAFSAVVFLINLYNRIFSFTGISIICSVCHGIGQMLCACCVMKSSACLYYLPVLTVANCFTGTVTGVIMNILFKKRDTRRYDIE